MAAAASSSPGGVGLLDRAISHVCGVAEAASPPPSGVGDRRVPATEAALDARGATGGGGGIRASEDGAGPTG
jgi:hypothetical protein